MRTPVGVAELVADQLVGRFLVGDAQQRFRHAHQQHAFLRGQVVLAHEGFDHALVFGLDPHPLHQVFGHALDLGLRGFVDPRRGQQLGQMLALVAVVRARDCRAQRVGGGGEFGRKDGLHKDLGGPGCEARIVRRAAS